MYQLPARPTAANAARAPATPLSVGFGLRPVAAAVTFRIAASKVTAAATNRRRKDHGMVEVERDGVVMAVIFRSRRGTVPPQDRSRSAAGGLIAENSHQHPTTHPK